jgi:hypothetical protein
MRKLEKWGTCGRIELENSTYNMITGDLENGESMHPAYPPLSRALF